LTQKSQSIIKCCVGLCVAYVGEQCTSPSISDSKLHCSAYALLVNYVCRAGRAMRSTTMSWIDCKHTTSSRLVSVAKKPVTQN